MPGGSNWTRVETLMAWALYMELPANTIVSENPSNQKLALNIERSPKAVKAKTWNVAGFDRHQLAEGKIRR